MSELSHKFLFLDQITRVLRWLLVVVILAVSFILPSTFRTGRYASPDETAVVRVTERFASFESARLPEPLVLSYPWLHPRSWVSQGPAIVPVGFLGWPMLLAPFAMVVGSGFLPFIAWLWFVSSFYPFYRLLSSYFSRRAAWIGVLLMAATPMVLLYANRPLFPNAGLLSGCLWSLWVIELAKRRSVYWWLVGFLLGLVTIIRPIELMWVLPWWVWMGSRGSFRLKSSLFRLLPVLATIFLSYLALNKLTYGAWWTIGYWIKDNPALNIKSVLYQSGSSFSSFFPFGIHPRSIVWNIRSFAAVFLWPTLFILVAAFVTYLRSLPNPSSLVLRWRPHLFVWLSLWTVAILFLVYGSGLYQDHVQPGAVTVANSFLRYLLPLSPLTGVAAAYVFDAHFSSSLSRRSFAVVFILLWLVFGVYSVTMKDDEGVLVTRTELARYASINDRAEDLFSSGSVIFSERSDKVFGSSFRSVSPLPSVEEIARFVREQATHLQAGLFVRPLSQRQRDEWRRQGLEAFEVGVFGREHLYRLVPR